MIGNKVGCRKWLEIKENFSAKTRDAEKGDAFLMGKKEIFLWLEIKENVKISDYRNLERYRNFFCNIKSLKKILCYRTQVTFLKEIIAF